MSTVRIRGANYRRAFPRKRHSLWIVLALLLLAAYAIGGYR